MQARGRFLVSSLLVVLVSQSSSASAGGGPKSNATAGTPKSAANRLTLLQRAVPTARQLLPRTSAFVSRPDRLHALDTELSKLGEVAGLTHTEIDEIRQAALELGRFMAH